MYPETDRDEQEYDDVDARDDNDVSQTRERSTNSSHSSIGKESSSRMGQSSTNGLRHLQRAKTCCMFLKRRQLNMTNFYGNCKFNSKIFSDL